MAATEDAKEFPPETGTSRPITGNVDGLGLREEDVKAEELRVRRLEAEKAIAAANASWWRKSDPLLLAIVAGIITLLGNIGVALYNGRASIDQLTQKAEKDIALEREKAKYSLILQAIATGNSLSAKNNINFFIASHLLEDDDNRIRDAVTKYLPTLPSLSVVTRRSLLDRVKALTPSQALLAAKTMEPYLSQRPGNLQLVLRAIDPNALHLKSGDAATRFLQVWVVEDAGGAKEEKEWEDALGTATQQSDAPK
jgi:hypothetical protein